jgi:hypothetical protein
MNSTNHIVPQVALYQEGYFIELIAADLTLWEDFGQFVYTFNTTETQAGCVKSAQTLSGMLTSSQQNDPSTAWNSTNYVKCYTDSSSNTTLSSTSTRPYTIMNSTNHNALIWTSGQNGFYFFTLKVLDPAYR